MLSQLDPSETALPHIQISDFSGIHDETRNALYRTMVHTAETSTDLNRGNHNIKTGIEFRSSFSNLRSAPVNFWDISVIKDTSVPGTEDHRLRFQAQFLNAFNHSSFGAPVANPTSGSFGLVLSDVTWPRRIMLGVKYIF